MTMPLSSPHRFAERLLLYGGGGAGKTNTVLNIASHLPADGSHMHVLDADYSMAYDRALGTDFQAAADRVTVHTVDADWEPFTGQLADIAANADDPLNDWLVIDPISPSWSWVQDWYLETVYGDDLAAFLVSLKKQHAADPSAYQAALMDNMNWPTIKKEYEKRVWRQIQRWRGNLVLVAESKALHFRESDDMKQMFSFVGAKPVGESRLPHVCSTTLYLDHPKPGSWTMTTIKDRNRVEMTRQEVSDFGLDYLVGIGGWQPVRGKRTEKAAGGEG